MKLEGRPAHLEAVGGAAELAARTLQGRGDRRRELHAAAARGHGKRRRAQCCTRTTTFAILFEWRKALISYQEACLPTERSTGYQKHFFVNLESADLPDSANRLEASQSELHSVTIASQWQGGAIS